MRCRRHSPGARPVRRAEGFTLLEVLLAMMLLASGLTLAFAVVRSTQAVSARGESLAAQSERMRAVDGALRSRLANALSIAWSDAGSERPVRFVGEPGRMGFVSDLPPYLGHGGPHLHELVVVGNGARQRLELVLSLVPQARSTDRTQPRSPEVLVDPLKAARFRYRGWDAQGGMSDWQASWPWPERMPAQVEVALTIEATGEWPPMVVSLPQGGSGFAP